MLAVARIYGRPLFGLIWFALVGLSYNGLFREAIEAQLVPNPFKDATENSLFYLRGKLTLHHARNQNADTELEFEEVVSPVGGFSYSRFKSTDKSSDHDYAIISDSQMGRMYLVQRASASDEFTCELDHKHQHKHVFPWLCESDRPEEGRPNAHNKLRKNLLYGVMSIWLNAIQRQVSSVLLNDDSPHKNLNLWEMHVTDRDVSLFFDKPTGGKTRGSIEKLISQSRLNYINVEHEKSAPSLDSRTIVREVIEIKEFVPYIDKQYGFWKERGQKYPNFLLQLNKCRAQTLKQRTFPSILKELTESPDRTYLIESIRREYEPSRSVAKKIVYQSELFSIDERARLDMYQSLEGTVEESKDNSRLPSEIYLEKFPKGKTSDISVFYHYKIEQGKLQFCRLGEWEPAPESSVMSRRVLLPARDENESDLERHVHGLGALLMNVPHMLGKHTVFKRGYIERLVNREDLTSKMVVETDQWLLYEKNSKYRYTIHFRKTHDEKDQHSFDDLMRVDVMMASSYGTVELVTRYDVTLVKFQFEQGLVSRLVTQPSGCPAESEAHQLENSGPEDKPRYDDDLTSDEYDSGTDDDQESTDSVQEATLTRHPFPDMYEYLAGRNGYEIVSKITINDKSIHMKETVLLNRDLAQIEVFTSKADLDSEKPRWIYYVNYQSESLFRVDSSTTKCEHLVKSPPVWWLRLFSAPLKYHTRATDKHGSQVSLIESNKMPTFGVGALWRRAHESGKAEFYYRRWHPSGRHELAWINSDGDPWSNMAPEMQFIFLDQDRDKDHKDPNKPKPSTVDSESHSGVPELIQIVIEQDDLYGKRKFSPFTLDIISMRTRAIKEPRLPSSCMNHQMDHPTEVIGEDEQIPRFHEVTGGSQSYCAYYRISQSTKGEKVEEDETLSEPDSQTVFECLNLDSVSIRGTIEMRGVKNTRTVYIESKPEQKTYIYNQKNRHCKEIARLEPLAILSNIEQSRHEERSKNIDSDRLVGLANLWVQMSEIYGFTLERQIQFDVNGLQREVHTYRAQLQLSDDEKVKVEATFEKRPVISDSLTDKRVHVRHGYKYLLKRLTIEPDNVNENLKGKKIKHGTPKAAAIFIDITYIKLFSRGVKFELPNECKEQAGGAGAEASFPRIENYWDGSNRQFHMRSEATSSMSIGNLKKVRLIDEWLFGDKLRVSIQGHSIVNIDVLFLGSTDELFDLTQEYRCRLIEPKAPASGMGSSDMNIFEEFRNLWSLQQNPDKESEISDLNVVFIGPLSLWKLASGRSNSARLITSASIVEKETLILDSYDHKLPVESWLVSNSPNSRFAWSMEFDFERHTIDTQGGGVKIWHVLKDIRLTSSFRRDSFGGPNLKTLVSLANYAYELTPRQQVELFMVPEGIGCKRSQTAIDQLDIPAHRFNYRPMNSRALLYQASLETFEMSSQQQAARKKADDDLPVRKLFPIHEGRLIDGSEQRYAEFHQSYSQLEHVRQPNGDIESKRIVLDGNSGLLYEIEANNGACHISQMLPNPEPIRQHWRMEFVMGERHSKLDMTPELFKQLFVSHQDDGFYLVNRYELDGVWVSSYEQSVDWLVLTDDLAGPASIVRRFTNPSGISGGGAVESFRDESIREPKKQTMLLHQRVHVKVLLYDPILTSQLAELNLELAQTEPLSYGDLIHSLSVADCYNSGDAQLDSRTANFVIEYRPQVDGQALQMARKLGYVLEEVLLRQLFRLELLTVSQLNHAEGAVRLDTRSDGLLRSHLSVLDAPPAHMYYERRPGLKVNDLRSVQRRLGSLESCSGWCDSLDCRAFSFCPDRICALLVTGDTKEQPDSDQSYQTAPGCVLLVRQRPIASLTKIRNQLNRIINEKKNPDEIEKLSLGDMRPERFYELESSFMIGRREDHNQQTFRSQLEPTDEAISFRRLLVGRQFSHKLLTSSDVESQQTNGLDYGQCLDLCASKDCKLMSFCSTDGLCSIITSTDLKLPDLKSLSQSDGSVEQVTCSISAPDPLANYELFAATRSPNWEPLVRLKDHSAIECASKCNLESKCRSFDLCGSSVCLLQESHVLLDSYDKSLLDAQQMGNMSLGSNESKCDHYSRSVLSADFKRLPGHRLVGQARAIMRGEEAARCALECLADEQCGGFEHCHDFHLQPADSCLLFGADLVRSSTNQGAAPVAVEPEDQRASCSFYLLRGDLSAENGGAFVSWISNPQGSLARGLASASLKPGFTRLLAHLTWALALGCLVGLVYRRLLV